MTESNASCCQEQEEGVNIVRMALKTAQEEEAREEARKDKAKEEARMYRQHLLLMMKKEVESEEVRDALIAKEEAAAFAKRQAQWNKDQRARIELMKEVHETREQQLSAKREAAYQHKLEKLEDLRKVNLETQKGIKVDRRISEEEHQRRIKHSEFLKTQIQEKRDRDAERLRKQQAEWDMAKEAENKYKQQIQVRDYVYC